MWWCMVIFREIVALVLDKSYEIYSDEVILEKLMLLLYSWLMQTGYYLLVVMVITCEILRLSLVAFGHSW